MSAGANSSISANVFPPPPPPGMNYLAVVQPSLNLVIIGGVWIAALVPLLIALFIFSTPKLRRTAIFILNILSILIGIVAGIINYYIGVHAIISPLDPLSVRYPMVYGTIISCLPLFVETILVIRVVAVYPPRSLSIKIAVLVYLPIILLKIARVVDLLVYFITHYPGLVNGQLSVLKLAQDSWSSTASKLGQVFQMLDNGFCSALFLAKLRDGLYNTGRVESRTGSYMSRIRALFWISVSNFVFPVILSFVQLVFSFRDSDHMHGTYLNMSNAYVNIIGVVFATVWSAGTRQDFSDAGNQSAGNIWDSAGPPVFANNLVTEKSTHGTTMNVDLDISNSHDDSISVLEEGNATQTQTQK